MMTSYLQHATGGLALPLEIVAQILANIAFRLGNSLPTGESAQSFLAGDKPHFGHNFLALATDMADM